jgi:hypothetical protein
MKFFVLPVLLIVITTWRSSLAAGWGPEPAFRLLKPILWDATEFRRLDMGSGRVLSIERSADSLALQAMLIEGGHRRQIVWKALGYGPFSGWAEPPRILDLRCERDWVTILYLAQGDCIAEVVSLAGEAKETGIPPFWIWQVRSRPTLSGSIAGSVEDHSLMLEIREDASPPARYVLDRPGLTLDSSPPLNWVRDTPKATAP